MTRYEIRREFLGQLCLIEQILQASGMSHDGVKVFLEEGLRPAIESWKLQEDLELWGLSIRTYSCLRFAKVRTYGELLEHSESDLLRVPNFGRKSLNEIKAEVARRGGKLKSDPEIRSD